MKKIRIILLSLLVWGTTPLSAQHFIGVRGGYGGGSGGRFVPAIESKTQWGLYSGGVSYKFYSETKYVGGIQVDLQYIGKGYAYKLTSKSDTSFHRKINTIELPIMWQPHVYMANNHVRVFMNLGVNFSYNTSSTYQFRSRKSGILERGTYPMQLTRDNRFGYGLTGGFGYALIFNRVEVSAEGRYTLGFADILKRSTKYRADPDYSELPMLRKPFQTPLDNFNLSIGVHYRFGKGVLRSAPPTRAQRRPLNIQPIFISMGDLSE